MTGSSRPATAIPTSASLRRRNRSRRWPSRLGPQRHQLKPRAGAAARSERHPGTRRSLRVLAACVFGRSRGGRRAPPTAPRGHGKARRTGRLRSAESGSSAGALGVSRAREGLFGGPDSAEDCREDQGHLLGMWTRRRTRPPPRHQRSRLLGRRSQVRPSADPRDHRRQRRRHAEHRHLAVPAPAVGVPRIQTGRLPGPVGAKIQHVSAVRGH